jgi:hypothetical protein
VIVSGGASLTVCSCVSFASTPASSSRSHSSRALPWRASRSRPNHSPRERTAVSAAGAAAASAARSRTPWRAALACGSPDASSSSTARPTAQASGLPPKVEPCVPGVKTPSTPSSPAIAESATIPPPSALPRT